MSHKNEVELVDVGGGEVFPQDIVDKAERVHKILVTTIKAWRSNRMAAWGCLAQIRKDELWKVYADEHPTFASYVSQPQIGLKPATANLYADTFLLLVEEHKIKVEQFENISTDKLLMLRQAKKPEKWIAPALELSFSDFRKKLQSEISGIPEEDIDREKRIKPMEKSAAVCPMWDARNCACKAGVKLPSRKDGLI